MELSKKLARHFLIADRNRGRSYFVAGNVSSLEDSNGLITACVCGNYEDYDVSIDLESLDYSPEYSLKCTCMRYEDGFYCKHLWATILAFEKIGKNARGPESRNHASKVHRIDPPERKKKKRTTKPAWQTVLNRVCSQQQSVRRYPIENSPQVPKERTVYYIIDVSEQNGRGQSPVILRLLQQEMRKNGEWGALKQLTISREEIQSFQNEHDREIMTALIGAKAIISGYYSGYRPASYDRFEISPDWTDHTMQCLQETGRFFWAPNLDVPSEDFRPVRVDRDKPFSVMIDICDFDDAGTSLMRVCLKREAETVNRESVLWFGDKGAALLTDRIVTISNPNAGNLLHAISGHGTVEIAKEHRAEFLSHLAKIKNAPLVQIPESWHVKSQDAEPKGQLSLKPYPKNASYLDANVHFRYGESLIDRNDQQTALYDAMANAWVNRNLDQEQLLLSELASYPFEQSPYYQGADYRIHKKNFQTLISGLSAKGWLIVWEGQKIKRPGEFNITVQSGADWFDLNVDVNYDGETIALPALLAALKSDDGFVVLSDGSRGQIPDELLRQYAKLATFGEVHEDSIRFKPTQAMLLDAMLQARTHDQQVVFDRDFLNYRKKLQSFSGIEPKNPPRTFQGELREYQREGLGWLHFLRDFKFGGCLADDMGLGKTIQVLSLLEARRTRRLTKNEKEANHQCKPKGKDSDSVKELVVASEKSNRRPSIVVVPKSLIFNWTDEALKFTPKLRILNYTGMERRQRVRESGGFDVLLTTYATMRIDIAELSQLKFDYAILDESQAIKNSSSLASKACRLLQSDHRLTMTGTPIENHLGELWSLFEFLNPGMLGRLKPFGKLANKIDDPENRETLQALSNAIKPYILRRTKTQVLKDLPEKTEQTLYCDMVPSQQKQYKELKEYYQIKLQKQIETEGMQKSKIQVLEALLRLRQTACDPRLIDPSAKPGAKIQLLEEQIIEVISEGHKVLVFSQFTSLLALVKKHFDDVGIKYEYLDGKTSDRAAKVKNFQEDENVSAFLISLKAGGSGLNLTAADYVFLLDPWWNPAAESQAIDRAHRIGQKRSVMAYRIICRDTVEEKIVTLQKSKRDLADSIISANESLIRSLSVDDLQLLIG